MNKLPIFTKGHHGGIDFHSSRKRNTGLLLTLFSVGVIVFFFVLIARLFQLTVVKGTYYRQLSDNNRIREVIIEPRRGKIVDRRGFTLVENSVADINGLEMRLTSKRHYIDPEAYAHVIGYRQVADKQDTDSDHCINKLKPGDKVGKKGVEKLYECELRGKHGKKLVEVDASGKPLRTLNVAPPIDGDIIQLSLDAELQHQAYTLIKDKRAVVVGMKPQTGEVVILTSSPSFNPQDFEDTNSPKLEQYFKDKDKPLFNRATEGTYPPGSTFKLVLAAGALEDKIIDEKLRSKTKVRSRLDRSSSATGTSCSMAKQMVK